MYFWSLHCFLIFKQCFAPNSYVFFSFSFHSFNNVSFHIVRSYNIYIIVNHPLTDYSCWYWFIFVCLSYFSLHLAFSVSWHYLFNYYPVPSYKQPTEGIRHTVLVLCSHGCALTLRSLGNLQLARQTILLVPSILVSSKDLEYVYFNP